MLQMTITNAGLDALVDAQNGDTDPIVITELAISETAFIAAPTLTAVPGELKRIGTLSGTSVAENVIHLTAQDSSTDTYTLRGFGLFLADGTLFAAYAQADPILIKVDIAAFLVSFDIAFADAVDTAIEFGDATFLFPPATETVKGAIEIATQAEVDAGLDDQRAVTPLRLATRLAALLAGVTASIAALTGRTISGGGLVSGGGDLSANRTLTVSAASTAEADAGAIATKALTPASIANVLADIAGLLGRTISGGGLATGGGTLSANRTITVDAASVAETNAGAINTKAVTPFSLSGLLGRTISGGGLATGGGDLTANRTITVTAASAAEIATGTENGKAVTPLAMAQVNNGYAGNISVRGLGGAITKMGTVSVPIPAGASVTFPVAFPNECHAVLVNPLGNMNTGDERDEAWWVSGISATGFTINTNDDGNTVQFQWVAFGH